MQRLILLGLCASLHHVNSHAFPVFDYSNMMQNIITITAQADEIQRKINRVQRQVESARRFSRKLQGYKFTNIRDLLRQIRSFRYRVRSIGYTYKSIVGQFEKTYGTKGNFSQKYSAWEKQSDDSIKDAMEAQGLVERSDGQMQDLNQAILSKNSAETDAETMQAIGEVNAIQAKQLNDLKQIIATDARARQSVIMEHRANEKAQREYEAHLMSDFSEPRTSRPLAHFPSLGSTAPRVAR
jgi:P-type conjugative transfer protein TrbJ